MVWWINLTISPTENNSCFLFKLSNCNFLWREANKCIIIIHSVHIMGDGLVAFKWEWGLLAFKRKWVAVVVLAWQTLSGLNLGDINQNIIQASTAKQDISLSPHRIKQFHFHYNHSHRKWFILTLFPGYDLGWFMLSSLVSGPRKVYPVTTTMIRGVVMCCLRCDYYQYTEDNSSVTWLQSFNDTCVAHMLR